MKAPHLVFLAGVELEALGCALRDRQPVAVSGLRLIELAGTATAAAREIRELRTQLEASQIEVQGMRAALDGHAGTHSPYLWTGPAEHHSAWLSGQQAVQKYGADRYQMGFEKAQEVAAVTAEPALRAQAETLARVQEALTPSGGTKGAYMGEFYQEVERCNPEWGEDPEEPEFLTERVMVGWDVIKLIMVAIRNRAALAQAGAGDQA